MVFSPVGFGELTEFRDLASAFPKVAAGPLLKI